MYERPRVRVRMGERGSRSELTVRIEMYTEALEKASPRFIAREGLLRIMHSSLLYTGGFIGLDKI